MTVFGRAQAPHCQHCTLQTSWDGWAHADVMAGVMKDVMADAMADVVADMVADGVADVMAYPTGGMVTNPRRRKLQGRASVAIIA